jgi:hypothetical protein
MTVITPNYGLKKPKYNEAADIEVLNENFDIIDEKLKEIEDKTGAPPTPKAQDIYTNDGISLEQFYQDSKTKLGKDLEARNEIIDIKLKLKEQTAINFINKTGIGFFDTFMDNTYIDLVNTTAAYNSTNKNVEFGTLTPYNVVTYEATITSELKVKYPNSAKKGDKLEGANEVLNIENIGSTFDVQDTTVITGNYSTQGNGGRKLVRLDNGNLVSATMITGTVLTIKLYKSTDNGITWALLYETLNSTASDVSLVAINNNVGLLFTNGLILSFYHINGFNGTVISSTGTLDSLNLIGNCSLAINESKTELHATWSGKNTTYPNSFNIRYCKGTINADGSVIWGSVLQVGFDNATGYDHTNPTIILDKNDKAHILHRYSANGSSYAIGEYSNAYTSKNWGSNVDANWGSTQIYFINGSAYPQSNPSAIYVPQSINGLTNGRIWVAWSGRDSVDSNGDNIRVSYSDDLGVTWSAMQKLTSGNSSQLYPSITANKNNEIFILWYGVTVLTPSNQQIRKIKYSIGSWGSIQDITNNTVSGKQLYYPSTLVDFNINFSNPLFIYQNGVTPSINFYGTWEDISHTKLTLQSPITKSINDTIQVIPIPQKLKMKNEIFDPFTNIDLNIYTNKRYMANVKQAVNNSKTVLIDKSDKPIYKGSKLWINNKENPIENLVGDLIQYDRQDTTIATGDYTTQGNGGRKLVRLDNGWLVAVYVKISTPSTIQYTVSKDNGVTWQNLCRVASTNHKDVCITTVGNMVYSLITMDGSPITYFKLDVINQSGDNPQVSVTSAIDTNQTSSGNCSLAINEAKTELHACWSSKNSTIPDSMNIRYSKGTINSDSTVTWGTVEYVDKYNTAGRNMNNPSIIVTSNNIPIIFFEFASSIDNQYSIGSRYRNPSSSNWEVRSVIATISKNQNSPSTIYVPPSINGLTNGRIWVTWYGTDGTDGTAYNIRVTYSDDLGVTWSTQQKLTTGNSYGQSFPSITANKNNEVFILWNGSLAGGESNRIRKIKWSNGVWGAIENTSGAAAAYNYPSTLVDFNINFSKPLFIYKKDTISINFYGTWEDFGGYTATLKDPVTLLANDKLSIIDMEVKQDGQALPLIAVDNEKFMYKSTNLNTDTSKIEILGSENKVESIVYVIA